MPVRPEGRSYAPPMSDIWTRLATLPPVTDGVASKSAVLVPLYEDAGGVVRLVLTKRPDSMRTHPGDVVFPGGGIEGGETPVEAALREAWEEIRLPVQASTILGGLAPVTTRVRTNWIMPVVARIHRPAEFIPDPAEVDVILEPPLLELLDDTAWRRERWMGRKLWFYEFPEGTLWGATAHMVRELLDYVRSDRGGVS